MGVKRCSCDNNNMADGDWTEVGYILTFGFPPHYNFRKVDLQILKSYYHPMTINIAHSRY